jgi:hypothetical protein
MSSSRVTKSNIDKTQIYIDKAKEKHGKEKYDYSLIKNIKRRECRVDIKCKKHGIFNISLHKHICGDGCRKCGSEVTSEKLSKSKNQFITECKTNDLSTYGEYIYEYGDLSTYKNRKSIIEYKCLKHNIIVKQKASERIRGCTACKDCETIKLSKAMSKTTEEFIDKCIQLIGIGIFSYEDTNYIVHDKEIIIKCIKHNYMAFLQTPDMHYKSKIYSCSLCKIEILNQQKKEIYEKLFKEKQKNIEEQLIQINNDKDNLYKCEINNFIYIGDNTIIQVNCLIHNIKYNQHLSSYLSRKINCTNCKTEIFYLRKINVNKMSNIKDCINIFSEIHKYKYDYSNSSFNKMDNNKLFIENILCKKHGLFTQRYDAHINGNGCYKCGKNYVIKKMTDKTRMSREELIIRSNKIYNNNFIITGEYINARTKIKIHCKNHDIIFEQVPHAHLIGYNGCPKCMVSKTSKSANEWIRLLLVEQPILQHDLCEKKEFKIPETNYRVDGYNYLTKTIYEFHGDYWHGNPKIYNHEDVNPTCNKTYGTLFKKTLYKEIVCRNKGYNYICIWEHEWLDIKKKIILIQKYWRKYKSRNNS